ncbi:FAD-binding protein [Streptomyces sp. NPDC047880]|uniref:(Fe-S)-binding protein n=1 Tax=Streptomyces sp. NPDC047880 TaxID=3155626 RepID=UPI00345636C6
MTTATRGLAGLTARIAELAPGLRVETGPGATGAYAYDASNYRVPPRAVAFPRTADDVVAVVRACRAAGVPVTARGGGTSMAGNAVGAGVPCTPRDGLCCGLTWVSTGQLGTARKVMARTVTALDDGDDRPIIVAEPSCAAALKRDVPELLGTEAARRVADRVQTFTGALADLADQGWTAPPLPENVVLQTHCHEYATFKGHRPADLLRRLGIRGVDEAEGCCGLAGNFGFEAQHYDTSIAVADLALRPRLDRLDGRPVVADGFSCATQIDHLAGDRGVRALHLAELLDPAADQPGETT